MALALGAAALWIALARAALAADGWSQLADTVFEHLTAEQGLPHSRVDAIAQDADGFLWIGTEGGLARWDGYRFINYRLNRQDPGALQDHLINVIHTDRRGRLWFGTGSGGLARYDRDRDRFVTYGAGPDGLSSPLVSAVIDDGDGALWVGTDGGLDHLIPDTGQISHLRHAKGDPRSLDDNHVRAVLLDRAGTLWVGTAKGLSRRMRGETGFDRIALPVTDEDVDVLSLFQASDGRIWAGSAKRGVFVLDPQTGAAQSIDLPVFAGSPLIDNIPAITEVAPGEILIATYGHGVIAVDAATLKSRTIAHDRLLPTSLGDDRVWSLYQDRSGLVWVGSFGGLDRTDLRAQDAQTFLGAAGRPNAITNEDVTAVLQAADGRTWLGLYDKGIVAVDPKAGRIDALPLGPMPEHTVILTLAALPTGDVLVGTVRGLYRTDVHGHGFKRVDWPGHGPLGRIDALLVDGERVWVACRDEGLWMLDDIDGRMTASRPAELDKFTDRRVSAIVPAGDHSFWIGTWFGITRIDAAGRVLERIVPNGKDSHNPDALSSGHVGVLVTDAQGRLWAGMVGSGIDVLVGRHQDGTARFAHIDTAQGLPHPNISDLLRDRAGKIWLTSMGGVATIDPDTLAVRALTRADGVGIPEYWHGSGAVTAEGDVLFGGRGGLTRVQPVRQPWTYRPPVVVTDLRVGGKSIPAGRFNSEGVVLTIPPDANSFAVEFSALDYSAPEDNRYAYRLDGFDKDWIDTDASRRLAAYTSLPPGDYTLRLRGSNREGAWSEAAMSLPIRVLPAWYQTLWFRLAETLAALLGVFIIVNMRTRYLRHQRRHLESVVAARTEELQHANRAKSAFLAVMSHEIRTPMNAISGLTELLKLQTRHPEQSRMLTLIQDSTHDLLRIINDILDYSKVEAGRLDIERIPFQPADVATAVLQTMDVPAKTKGLALTPEIEPGLGWAYGDPGRLRQILLNLVGNAVKFTQAGSVTLALARSSDGSRLSFSITDTGIGIPESARSGLFTPYVQAEQSTARRYGGTGLGLAISRRLIDAMGGTIGFDSTPGIGSRFWIELPLEPVAAHDVPVVPAAEPEVQPSTIAGARVLVAEDEITSRAVIAGQLARLGIHATVVEDGAQAFAAYDTQDFDLLITDCRMPVMDGFALTRKIRAVERATGTHIPILALTADASQAEVESCREAGMDAYLSKPASLAQLTEHIGALLAGRAGAASEQHPSSRELVS